VDEPMVFWLRWPALPLPPAASGEAVERDRAMAGQSDARRGDDGAQRASTRRQCARAGCGKTFEPTSPRQKFCSVECRTIARATKTMAAAERQRASVVDTDLGLEPEPERPFDARERREPADVTEALRPPAMPWERNGPAR
jgi:hypothetical protein